MSGLIWAPAAWLTLGVIFVILEVVVPGYLLLGFGLAALGVALLTFLVPSSWAAAGPVADLVLVLIWVGLALLIWYVLALKYGKRGRTAQRGKDINDFENRG